MINPELLKYIKDSLANKVSLETIKKNLSGAGWPDSYIDEAVNSLNQPKTEQPKLENNKLNKKQIPAGIKILAVIGYIGVALDIISGLILILVGGTLSAILSSILPVFGSITQITMIAGISILGGSVLNFFMSRGLWKGQNWARIVSIIFGIIVIIGSLLGIIAGSYVYGGIGLAVSLLITIYLLFSKKVKEAFV